MYTLRPYQQDAVDATLNHFRKESSPAVIVLPTGAGKSLVIAELANVARGRVLILTHVKELVEQNHAKYESYGKSAGIFSAGLKRKESQYKVIFGSIQSVANAEDNFFNEFTLLVIDECHRVSMDTDCDLGGSKYKEVIDKLKKRNPKICILGLTATPYRLGTGFIYEYHLPSKMIKSSAERFFKKCIYELSIGYMVKNKYLTTPIQIDSPVACYNFENLKMTNNYYVASEIEAILKDQKRITPMIIKNILDLSLDRLGVMIFTSTINHAKEVLGLLPAEESALVIGDTENYLRDEIIQKFKERKIKYLVNVSVLTTGFDAPHVDVIAILRPTESVGLYQQIVGRGLRLSPEKNDCLILDYTGLAHQIFSPVIEDEKPSKEAVVVDVECPKCLSINHFYGIKDSEGILVEHFGRKCQHAEIDPNTQKLISCNYRFRFKLCEKCQSENDTAAKICTKCNFILSDPDKKLKEAMTLQDAHVLRVDSMFFYKSLDSKKEERLEIRYYDVDGEFLKEYFYFNTPSSSQIFYYNFIRMHLRIPEKKVSIKTADEAILLQSFFRSPRFVIGRKIGKFWNIREKVF